MADVGIDLEEEEEEEAEPAPSSPSMVADSSTNNSNKDDEEGRRDSNSKGDPIIIEKSSSRSPIRKSSTRGDPIEKSNSRSDDKERRRSGRDRDDDPRRSSSHRSSGGSGGGSSDRRRSDRSRSHRPSSGGGGDGKDGDRDNNDKDRDKDREERDKMKESRHRMRRSRSAAEGGSTRDIEVKRSSTHGDISRKSSSGRYKESLSRKDETPEERDKRKQKERDERRERDRGRDRETSEERRIRKEREKNETPEERDIRKDKERAERKEKDRERDSRRRSGGDDRGRDRDETSEDRKERKKRERADREKDDIKKKEREEKKEKEKLERRSEAEAKKLAKLAMKAERRKEKSFRQPTHGSVMEVNRADLQQVSKEDFSTIYQLGKKIYEEGDTCVHICKYWATGVERCVKITPKKSSSCHEFDMLKNTDHPNTLSMYDLFVNEAELGYEWYLVVDLCKGGTLFNYLQKRSAKPNDGEEESEKTEEDDDPFGLGGFVAAITGTDEVESDIEEGEYYGLDEKDVKKIMMQVLSCVNYLHKNRLVHADLKPLNVLLADRKDVSSIKLIDFDNSVLLKNEDDRISFKKGSPAYMAPEVHAGEKYGSKCDVWSCGVMAYELLSNSLPFGDESECTEEEIAKRVKEGKFSTAGPAWGHVSSDAKDFIKSLLVLREKKRPAVEKAIVHKWLANEIRGAGGGGDLQQPIVLSKDPGAIAAMSNFRNFKADSKLKKAVCTFIASRLLTKAEKAKIDSVFFSMDITRDGKISKTEVKAGFFQVIGTFLPDTEIDEIFDRIDCDGTGEIEYSEFCVASMSEDELLNKNRLKQAFQLFDQDNSGSITIDELREFFSAFEAAGDIDQEYIDKVIAQVDGDGDGDVSFEEFCDMMINGVPIPE